ncbi:hypothetical protein EPI10_011935 [Gossypium australe]|uniref:Uncharacterized protein n=1 Tax=Gossypium australe TaxID=47621 RepID=A0A5B6WA28_9ROSI|nr:hypothetical protein EPI10_011935 [Gossypium australe]
MRSLMTRSSSTPIEPYPDPKQLIRHNRQMMNIDPPAVTNLPWGNPLFGEPQEQQGNNRGEVPMAQRMLREYALPTLDVVRGSIE